MRGVRRPPLQGGGAGGDLPRPHDPRRAGDDRRRRHRFLRRGEGQRRMPPHRRPPAAATGGGVGLHQAGTVVVDALGRRVAAREAGVVSDKGGHAGQRAVSVRRTHHRAPFPRHQQAAQGLRRTDPQGTHRRHRRTQHGRHQVRRLGDRPRARGGRRRRQGSVRRNARGTRNLRAEPYGTLPEAPHQTENP